MTGSEEHLCGKTSEKNPINQEDKETKKRDKSEQKKKITEE